MEKHQTEVPLCQSCAMPLERVEDFGTDADGHRSSEYCQYCFQSGKFTEPEITMKQMIDKCSCIMKQMHIRAAQIRATRELIPTLKRWKK
ncbi:zinc ribbon domain-containing protein [candidate division WOR-3 bacterium]|nr:zinc ribbon domain-containing protein [candidate division WOR-3 bacterium]